MSAVSYGQALAMLESIAGVDVLRVIDANASMEDKRSGEWQLKTRAGIDVAVANPRLGVCECYLLPAHLNSGVVVVGEIQTVRVVCPCRQPKVLRWPIAGGDRYVCGHCRATVFLPSR